MYLPALIQDLAIILGVAAIVTFLFRLIKQPVVLGYIVAGIIVGPYSLPIFQVTDRASVETWAELGVIFLMFALGLEFSFRRLAKVGVSAAITAALQIFTMIILGYVVAQSLGWTAMDAIFLGCMIAISSTTIIIKALEELKLKTRKFAELVFGILIVEDLGAIVILVALSSIATKASFSGIDLFGVGGKMLLIVGSWLVIGMFVVPRFIHAVGKKGNNEMMIVVSLALCLALVTISTYFHFSVALGAFIMGSILAETNQAHRIEELLKPLKDVFGAVFFVSVGMLLNPAIVLENLIPVIMISAVVIAGKVLSVSIGTLATGQSIFTSAHAGFSMAQIGEFSFIIATLGLTLGVIDDSLYPIIVAVSLITTFTTPYLIKAAPQSAEFIEGKLPRSIRIVIEEYGAWFQRRSSANSFSSDFYLRLLRWTASSILVIAIFVVAAQKLAPWLAIRFPVRDYATSIAWLLAFILASPFIWAMVSAFRNKLTTNDPGGRHGEFSYTGILFLSRLLTILLVGLLSSHFFPTWIALTSTILAAAILLILLKKRLESYYHWFESHFVSGLKKQPTDKAPSLHAHLLPWEAHLVAISVDPNSEVLGRSLAELKIRERFGVSIVVLRRGQREIIAPKASEQLFPGDELLCFGNDDELDQFGELTRASQRLTQGHGRDDCEFSLGQIELGEHSKLIGQSIREIDFQTRYHVMVVGIERQGMRIENPKSDLKLQKDDRIWVVGEMSQVKLTQEYHKMPQLA